MKAKCISDLGNIIFNGFYKENHLRTVLTLYVYICKFYFNHKISHQNEFFKSNE